METLLDYKEGKDFFAVLPLNYSDVVSCQNSSGQFCSAVALYRSMTAAEKFAEGFIELPSEQLAVEILAE